MSDPWYYSQTPHPIMAGHIIAEDDSSIVLEQRGVWYLVRRDSGNGYKLPTPLPDVAKEELLAWAKGVTIKSLLN